MVKVKRNKTKTTRPVERVYKNGREAIVLSTRKRPQGIRPVKRPVAPIPVHVSPVKVNEYELPSYNVTQITLIVKDPFWIYAYWEIANESLKFVRQQLGGTLDGCRFVLRVYDITYVNFDGSNANRWFDIEVGPHANNWYINLWSDNGSYCAELGIISGSGRFFPLARSNFVHTPRARSSNRINEVWMDLGGEFKNWPEAIHHEQSAYEVTQYPYQYKGFPYKSQPLFPGKRRRIHLTEDDVKRYYNRLSPRLREIVFSRLSKKRLYRYLYKDLQDKSLQGYYDANYFRRLSRGYFRKIMLGSSEMMFIGASESLPQGASEALMGPKARKFFFEIGAELIVYGRTEPDAEVCLGSKKIDLRRDGTFSLRFALPDGKIPLNFTAVSKDKIDTRKINTAVERKATHSQ